MEGWGAAISALLLIGFGCLYVVGLSGGLGMSVQCGANLFWHRTTGCQ